jgi:excisionase family DNA binding protein
MPKTNSNTTSTNGFDSTFYSQFPEKMSARLASAYLDMSEQRLRALVHENVIPATKDGTSWIFDKSALDAYRAKVAATPRTVATRENKTGKLYVVRVRFDQYEAVTAALGQMGITLEPRYKAKSGDAEATPAAEEVPAQ